MKRTRVGLIGYGFIGAGLHAALAARPELGIDVAFVYNRTPSKLEKVPAEQRLERLEDFAAFKPDLIVEMSHPHVSRDFGALFLAAADYLPLSVTAMADPEVEARLIGAAKAGGRRLLIPHGALVGADSLVEWRHMWEEVTITFRKHPKNIDFSSSGIDPATIMGETLLYDGPARGIAAKFPHNVNTMVTCGLATVGLDKCRARLIAAPSLNVAIAEVEAIGKDGSRLTSRKEQPAVGVSGTEMMASQLGSILRALGAERGMVFV